MRIVYSNPMRDHGEMTRRKTRSYHSGPASLRIEKRVIIAAARGIPRKTATLVATIEYETSRAPSSPLMMLMKKMAIGAYRAIWRIELIATRIAQYSLSPPARPFHISTMAIHRARPTRIRPTRSSGLSGRNAHAKPSWSVLAIIGDRWIATYHQEGCNNPVDDYAEEDLLPDVALGEDLMKTFVSDFA